MSNPFDQDYDPSSRAGGGDFNVYQRQINESMQNTLSSTMRSMRALEESEQIGAATAEDLVTQREKLETTNRRLDEMQGTMGQTQRNLNSIKSIFGGVKNYFSKAPAPPKDLPQPIQSKNTEKLQSTVDNLKRSPDTSGFYAGANERSGQKPSARIPGLGDSDSTLGAMDNQIDENLDLMSQNLLRIRGLGRALGDEIEEQNALLDNINAKTDKTGAEIKRQDAQVRDIMGLNRKSKQKPTAAAEPARPPQSPNPFA